MCDNYCPCKCNRLDTVELSLLRFVDSSADAGEYLKVEVSPDGIIWSTIWQWGEDDNTDDDTWNMETADVTQYVGNNFTIKVSGLVSSSSEDIAISDLYLVGMSNSAAPPVATQQSLVLDENFDDITAWSQTGNNRWVTVSDWSEDAPGGSANKFAAANGCRSLCTLELASGIDMRSYTGATLDIIRFVDSSLDAGEYLALSVHDGTSWHMLAKWGQDDNTNTDQWETDTFDITNHINTGNFKVKLETKQSRSSEDVGVDMLRINR